MSRLISNERNIIIHSRKRIERCNPLFQDPFHGMINIETGEDFIYRARNGKIEEYGFGDTACVRQFLMDRTSKDCYANIMQLARLGAITLFLVGSLEIATCGVLPHDIRKYANMS